MSSSIESVPAPAGWLLNREFDVTFVFGVALLALASGLVVLLRPQLFLWVLTADLWLLGYHHVISTFTRLAFDKRSLREYWFFVFLLPPIVLTVTFAAAWTFGYWIIASVYLYWQWFHYTRQSWGISKVYAAKSGGQVDDDPIFAGVCFYLIPIWGILYRSWQAPETFLFVELRVIPVPEILVQAVGVAAVLSTAAWLWTRFKLWQSGRLPIGHTFYMLSHFLIFAIAYRLIENITIGWLVVNVWHNAQYILFVWLYNANRFKSGIDPMAPFLSEISQPRNILRYMFCCLAISTMVYWFIQSLTVDQLVAGLPMAIVVFQAVNFHHYIVDSRIWKVRKPSMRSTLGLSSAPS